MEMQQLRYVVAVWPKQRQLGRAVNEFLKLIAAKFKELKR